MGIFPGDVTLNFDKGGGIPNTASITASGTLMVNAGTLTNRANQVNVDQIWSKVQAGYVGETGTTSSRAAS